VAINLQKIQLSNKLTLKLMVNLLYFLCIYYSG